MPVPYAGSNTILMGSPASRNVWTVALALKYMPTWPAANALSISPLLAMAFDFFILTSAAIPFDRSFGGPPRIWLMIAIWATAPANGGVYIPIWLSYLGSSMSAIFVGSGSPAF